MQLCLANNALNVVNVVCTACPLELNLDIADKEYAAKSMTNTYLKPKKLN